MSVDARKWVRVTHCGNIPIREGRLVEIAGRAIAIFNVGVRFLAVENRCPHRGGPLADGIVSGTSVTCPLHAWKFDLLMGSAVNHPESHACLTTFPTRVEEGIICVEVPLATEPEETPASVCEHRDRPLRWVQRKPFKPPEPEICES
jgi:nitrite reductase (NADH) small subunit